MVERTTVGDIQVVYVETDLPFVASIFVRMGRLDETIVTSGMSHLLEHLVLSREWPVDSFNGTVMPLTTHLWFAESSDVALERVGQTLRAMTNPPLGLIAHERGILRTEAFGRGRSQPGLHGLLRFGSSGLGVFSFSEHGLRRATRGAVMDWARRFFNAGNVVISLAGKPPEGLDWSLPPGSRVAPPDAEVIPYLEFPLTYVNGPAGAVSASMMVARTHAATVFREVAELRLRQWLRHQAGVSYNVEVSYEPINTSAAQLVIHADCRPHSATFARNALVAVLDDIASLGPSDEELKHAVDEATRQMRHPMAAYDELSWTAHQLLDGLEIESLEDAVTEREKLNADDVAVAAREAFDTLIVGAPDGTPHLGGRFHPYPLSTPTDIDGEEFVRSEESPADGDILVVGDEGVGIRSADSVQAGTYADATAFISWDDGTIELITPDGFIVLVDPADWADGERAAETVRKNADEARLIDASNDPPEFEDPDLVEAETRYDAHEWPEAAAGLERGLAKEPESPRAWRMLAVAYKRQGLWERAVEASRRAAEAEPSSGWALRFLATLLRDAADHDGALAAIREAVRRQPVRLATLAEASAFLCSVDEFDEALQIGRRAVELYPEESDSWFALGWSARAAGDRAVAVSALTRAVEITPDNSMWHNNLGVALMDAGEYEAALDAFEKAHELDAKNRYAIPNQARALSLLGRTEEARARWVKDAEARLTRADNDLRERPDDPTLVRARLDALGKTGRRVEAVSEARRLVQLAPSIGSSLGLSDALVSSDGFAAGLEVAEEALLSYPGEPDVLAQLAWLCAALGDAGATRAAAEQYAAIRGDERAGHVLGLAAYAEGDWERALELFDRELEISPRSCCSTVWRGMARAKLGDIRGATVDADRARRLNISGCNSLALLDGLLKSDSRAATRG